MALISIGKIDKNLIPIFVGCIVYFFSRLLFTVKETTLFNHKIIPNVLATFSKLFAFIPYIIIKKRSKQINNSEIQKINNNDIELIYTDTKIEPIGNKGRYFFLSAILLFVQAIIFLYTYAIKTNTWIWDILITSLFYYLLFKIKLYRHHYLSMIIIILTGLVIDLVLKNFQNDITNNLLLLFMRIIRETLFSLNDVLNKYMMEKKFCSPYEICLYTGLIDLIFYGIFEIFDYFFLELDNFGEYFNNFNSTEFWVCLGVIVTQFGLYLVNLIITQKHTPCHIFIVCVFGQLAYYLDFSVNSILLILCFIFILFMSLIFNEIIELNFCGLSDNTKKNIIIRADNEYCSFEKNYSMNTIYENDDCGRETIESVKNDSINY